MNTHLRNISTLLYFICQEPRIHTVDIHMDSGKRKSERCLWRSGLRWNSPSISTILEIGKKSLFIFYIVDFISPWIHYIRHNMRTTTDSINDIIQRCQLNQFCIIYFLLTTVEEFLVFTRNIRHEICVTNKKQKQKICLSVKVKHNFNFFRKN